MPKCLYCGRSSPLITSTLGACADCIREHPKEVLPRIRAAQAKTRREFDLPQEPPQASEGTKCPLCVNECLIPEGGRGFCGLRTVKGDRLFHLAGTAKKGILHWYFDPLPTNCVAAWVCDGSKMRGHNNLAVFYGACSFNCLSCQNWHYREMSPRGKGISAEQLAAKADSRTFCVCYFGGDPVPQLPHALAVSRLLARQGIRICWETNGSMNPKALEEVVLLSLETGGCVKFDLKAYDESLHIALTGVTNRRTLENFARAAAHTKERPNPPLLVASTLLVPGYVDACEVKNLARFLASLDPNIPYSLLAFAPHFYLHDLPSTSVSHAQECEGAAREAGVVNVHIGNRHLLSLDY